jgi:hypothetical protein
MRDFSVQSLCFEISSNFIMHNLSLKWFVYNIEGAVLFRICNLRRTMSVGVADVIFSMCCGML